MAQSLIMKNCGWPRVFRFILASLRDRETAENLTQDCL